MAADKTLIAEINGNVRHLIQLLQTRSKKIRKDTGITGPQLLAMKTLFESPDLSISELARRIYLHPATVVGIVDRLEGQSFVKRRRSKEDLRQVNVRLTAKGKGALRKAPGAAQASELSGLETLPDKKLIAPLGQPLAARPDSRTLGKRARRKTPQGPAPKRRDPAQQARRQKIVVTRGALPVAEAGIPLKLAARSCAVCMRQRGA